MPSLGFLLRLLLVSSLVVAQQSSSSSSVNSASSTRPGNPPTPTANVTSIVTSVAVTRSSLSGGSTIQITGFVPTTIVSTIAQPSNTSTSTTASASETASSATPSATQSSGPVLDTRVDPAFGVLGALLVLTGLPSAFLGHKNRWSSFFLTGFYTLALVCLSLILKFGVLVAVHPPNTTLRGLFVLACGVAGIAGGGVSIFFWQQAKYFIGGWGGFAIGLWVQCFRDGGLIQPIGFRWILYIGCAAVGFVLCTIPKLHYHMLIASTAVTGASVFILGVDCFTTAGLKEFYVYNLGFSALFPKFRGMRFPLSQTMAVEIGLIAAVALMGIAVQLRVLKILKRKLAEINAEEKKREAVAEEKAVMRMENVKRDLEAWEKEHGDSSKRKSESELSAVPLMKDSEEPSTPGGDSTLVGHNRLRTRSGVSDFDVRPVSRFSQNPGLLPAMNLGLGLDSELPGGMVADGGKVIDPDLMKKEELLAEIQTIRKSIDALRSETGSSSGDSRRPSLTMNSRPISGDLGLAQASGTSSHLRPPRAPRERTHSMDILSSLDNRAAEAAAIGRSASTPLRDDDWEAYLRERKLFQPPGGPSAPIATTYVTPVPRPASEFIPVPDAVTDALTMRKRRESAFELSGEPERVINGATQSSDPRRVSGVSSQAPRVGALDASGAPKTHKRSASGGPVNILPPRPVNKPEPAVASRTHTFEELVERHQQKLRSLQEPVSKREHEQAELAAARSRWERSKAVEKAAMAKRQAEKEAALTRKSKEKEEYRRSKGPGDLIPGARAASGLAIPGAGSNRRTSTAKVQEWQRYQQEADDKPQRRPNNPTEHGVLPFPNTTSTDRRKSRSGIPQARDPPS